MSRFGVIIINFTLTASHTHTYIHTRTYIHTHTHMHTHQSISIATELNDKVGEGVVHCNMAMTYEMLCNLEQALEHHEKVQLTTYPSR